MLRFLLATPLCVLAAPVAAQEVHYEPGQVWTYETAPGDNGSLIKIQEIEALEGKEPIEVFHISMIGIRLADGTVLPGIMHMPVSRRTLDHSVIELSDSDVPFPDHREGLAMWRDANGGVFTISLAAIADVVREQVAASMN
ncbi:hypothetical protein [Aurantiacibacter aquimixticola]|uniref:Uncharacterized protein n=1 Tax=Aurantiacibacter aquimixticola TaxID=1958945 RepID=A0A419RTR1_9SPHN|nr:hypothetical protein [Aurantiacibacter aquimixticola]RJY09177.1 hypothetical protein D6201_07220 [Aurantiacibacter aquimixticola]